MTLAKARARCDDARRLIADNADPGVAKQAERTARADTFRVLAMEWLSKQNLARHVGRGNVDLRATVVSRIG